MEFKWSELIWPFKCKPLQKLNINTSKIEFLLPKYNKEGMRFVNNFWMQTIMFFNVWIAMVTKLSDAWKCPCQEQVNVSVLAVWCPTAATEIKM